MTAMVPVLGLPGLDITRGRVEMSIPQGASLAEMLDLALPGLPKLRQALVRITVGDWPVPETLWHRVRPLAGVPVLIRVIPGQGGLRSALSIAITIAAIAAGQFYVGPALLALGATAGQAAAGVAVATAALSYAGSALLNALIPVKPPSNGDTTSYSINGWRNAANPNGTVPSMLGRHRVAPPWAGLPYTTTIGDERYITGMVAIYGDVTIENILIGDTPFGELPDVVEVDVQTFGGGSMATRLYPAQVIEDQVGQELVREDDDDPAEPIKRTSAADAAELSIDLHFPGGLFWVDDKDRKRPTNVDVAVRARRAGSPTWQDVTTISVTANTQRAFFRTFRWTPPSRGRYVVELTRLNESNEKGADRCDWVCLRAHRPEAPIQFDAPLTVISARVRASKATNGTLDALNFVATRICPDWDAEARTWITRPTRNPASAYRYVLQGRENPHPKRDEDLDLDGIQAWHEHCSSNALAYDVMHDFDATLEEVLADICRAGRATPQNTGTKLGVCVDRPRTAIVAHIGPRNSWNFSGSVSYGVLPDAFRVRFRDETNDFEETERIVPRPDLVGDPVTIEALQLPGITNPDIVWQEARRAFRVLMYRRETWTCQQDIESLIAMRGDFVLLSYFRQQVAGAVLAVDGRIVTIDEAVTMEAGESYVCRFRLADGSSMLVDVLNRPGERRSLTLSGAPQMPAIGDLFFFGPVGGESVEAIVKDVEMGEEMTAQITFIPHAPEIDAETRNDPAPPWDGRVGAEVDEPTVAPAPPIIARITSGADAGFVGATTYPPPIVYLTPGSLGVAVGAYEVDHRQQGASIWATITVSASAGYALLTSYAKGSTIEVRARALGRSLPPLASAYTAVATHVIGANDPAALPSPTGFSATLAGGTVTLSWSAPNDPDVALSRVWRAREGIAFAAAVDLFGPIYHPIDRPVMTDAPGYGRWQYWVTVDDDQGFRESAPAAAGIIEIYGPEMVVGGDFASAAPWTTSGNWTISTGAARHAASSNEDYVYQPAATAATATYRATYTVVSISTGSVTPCFVDFGAGSVLRGTARTAPGTYTEDIVLGASAYPNLGFAASAGSNGVIDNLSVKRVA